MMGDDSDDDKPLLFQFKNSKGSVQVKCSARNGATNSSQNSMGKPRKNSKNSDDEDSGKPLQVAFSAKHSEKASEKVAMVVDVTPRSAERPLNGLAMKTGTCNLASVKVYTKRKKQVGDEVPNNVVTKKLKLPDCGSSKDELDDDDYNIPLLAKSSGNRKKHSTHHVVECQKVSVTFSTSVYSTDMGKSDGGHDGLKQRCKKEGPAAAVDDSNASEERKLEQNDSSDDDDANGNRDPGADGNISNDAIGASNVDHSDFGDANGSRDNPDDPAGNIDHDKNNVVEDSDDDTDCEVLFGKGLDEKRKTLTGKSGDETDDPRVSCGAAHIKPRILNASSKLEARLNLVKEEDEDDNLPLSKMSHSKRRIDPATKDKISPAYKNAAKKEDDNTNDDGCGTIAGHFDTKSKKHLGKRAAENSKLSAENKLQASVEKKEMNVKDVLVNITPSSSEKKVTDVKEVILEKATDVRAVASCESRRQQLLALSKSLADTDSEEDKEEEEAEEDEEEEEDDDEEEKDDVEEEDEEEDDDEDFNSPVAAKSSAVAKVESGSARKMPAATSKAKSSVKSKSRTPPSATKAGKEIIVDDYDDEEEEEEEESEEEDEEWNKSARKMPGATLKAKSSVKSKSRTPSSASKEGNKITVDDYDDDDDEEEEEESEEEDEEWNEDKDDDDYDMSEAKKRKKTAARKRQRASPNSAEKVRGSKKQKEDGKEKQPRKKAKKLKDAPGAGEGQRWTSLEHSGVIFPPFYQPHGVKMLYEGKTVDLTPEEEEVATMFAVMKETDYAAKPKFLANFWNDWKKVLGPNHVIQTLEGCDFTPIYEWHLAEKEKKQKLTTEEKKAIKEEKLKQEEKYMWAVVDGVKEKVGNFRVEPPGLFRGRGEHPKMGKVKRRIYPEDIVINIGADSPVPECPLPGHSWKEVRHDDTVTWLAYWNDPINTKEQKYVFLSPSSTLKGQSDKEKYEKARVLKDYISDIRKTYTENFASSDPTTRQIAVATYLIDQLALRAGNEKDDDEADTVGCCSLKVEHVSLVPPLSVEFDFLGKDSIRYLNTVKVVKPVYEAIGDFKKDKTKGMDLFDRLDTNKLNAHLKNIMPQLTAKVFRTYNASITLDSLLLKTDGHIVPEKIAAYQLANKEVAILCNHQRSVSKSHGTQMEKLEGKFSELNDLLDELQKDLEKAKKGKSPGKDEDGNPIKSQNPIVLEKKILQTKQKMERMKLDMKTKEDLKTVALGTSKINYMDPRITVAWCKQHEVPIEKIFNKSLLAKFGWAMDVDMSFRF